MNKESMFINGMFSLLIANLLGRFGGQHALTDFLEGMFTGVSLVLMLSFLIRYRMEKRINDKYSKN